MGRAKGRSVPVRGAEEEKEVCKDHVESFPWVIRYAE